MDIKNISFPKSKGVLVQPAGIGLPIHYFSLIAEENLDQTSNREQLFGNL